MVYLKIPSSVSAFKTGAKYVWNVQVLNREGKPVGDNNGTSELFVFTTGPTTPPSSGKLINVSPANGSTFNSGEAPEFKWEKSGDIVIGPGAYKIRIVEIKGDQSPESALRTNKPFFEKDSISALRTNKPIFEKDSMPNFKYPTSAPAFKDGQKYAWIVSIFDRWGNLRTSTPTTFVTKMIRCACGTWSQLMIDGKSIPCGSTLKWNRKKPFEFITSFQCIPNNASCVAKISWEIRKDGKLVKNGVVIIV
jgi:hypothetical protein